MLVSDSRPIRFYCSCFRVGLSKTLKLWSSFDWRQETWGEFVKRFASIQFQIRLSEEVHGGKCVLIKHRLATRIVL